MATTAQSAIAVIGVDIGKNSFHVVGLDGRGAIVLRQKWSRGQVEARFANMSPCLIGMEACVGAHHLKQASPVLPGAQSFCHCEDWFLEMPRSSSAAAVTSVDCGKWFPRFSVPFALGIFANNCPALRSARSLISQARRSASVLSACRA